MYSFCQCKKYQIASTHLTIEVYLLKGYHFVCIKKIAAEHIFAESSKDSGFVVISTLLKLDTRLTAHLPIDLDPQK